MIVQKDAPLDQVCRAMAEHNKSLVGIFTWLDALYALDSLFQTKLH
jgi:hypothetical protein